MSQRLARLEALLERVRRNVQTRRPRGVAASRASDALAPPPPPVEAAPPDVAMTPFSLTGEVSTLEIVENETLEPLGEGDLVEVSSDLLDSLPPPETQSWEASQSAPAEDEPPVSSQRPRIAPELEPELEVGLSAPSDAPVADEREPLLTPPPESGPQEAPAGLFTDGGPEVETLVADSPPLSQSGAFPTPEQIGQAVELEEAGDHPLELDVAQARPRTVPPSEELEALLAQPAAAAMYDEALAPPPGAREELVAHDRRVSSGVVALDDLEDERTSELPEFQSEAPAFPEAAPRVAEAAAFPGEAPAPAYVPPSASEATGMAAPEVFAPALPRGGLPELKLPAASFRAQTFVELLDASIALRGS